MGELSSKPVRHGLMVMDEVEVSVPADHRLPQCLSAKGQRVNISSTGALCIPTTQLCQYGSELQGSHMHTVPVSVDLQTRPKQEGNNVLIPGKDQSWDMPITRYTGSILYGL